MEEFSEEDFAQIQAFKERLEEKKLLQRQERERERGKEGKEGKERGKRRRSHHSQEEREERQQEEEEREEEERERAERRMIESFGGEEMCFYRFLYAKSFNMERAIDMFQSTLQWRRENGVEDILENHSDVFQQILPFWPGGYSKPAKNGSPTCIYQISRLNLSSLLHFPEIELTRFYICWMEISLRLQREGFLRQFQETEIVEKGEKGERRRRKKPLGMIEVYDLSGLSMHHVHPYLLNQLRKILRIGQDHYPGNLLHAFIINTPWMFHTGWKVVQPVISKKNLDKLSVHESAAEEKISKYFRKENLPTFLGGDDQTFPSFVF